MRGRASGRTRSLPLAEQPIKDVVITVPAFFNQAERRAVLHAAAMADLKVLQLINDNTAVALNYGVFRRKDINATAQVPVLGVRGACGAAAAGRAHRQGWAARQRALPVSTLPCPSAAGGDVSLGGEAQSVSRAGGSSPIISPWGFRACRPGAGAVAAL